MLLAEIHGKTLQAARDSEDYLTSAVFGHLRYVPPNCFWPALFGAAKGVPGPGGSETSLADALAAAGTDPRDYDRLSARFWRPHPILGEPDLLLHFSGRAQPSLALLVEAKLWSGKSGVEENDQLARYLRVLDDLGAAVPPEACRYLVYLTPRESLAEVEDSLAWSQAPERDRARLFRLRWQDVLAAARRSAADAPDPFGTLLSDVATFLSRLGLEYFAGFNRVAGLAMLAEGDGAFLRASDEGGGLLTRLPERARGHGEEGVMGDVIDDYGRRVGMALKAVKQLHADASRLLSDCDGTIGKGRRVCTRSYAATAGLSSLLGGLWMAEGAYRCYAADPERRPGLVEAVCLCFLGDKVARDEPVLIAGRISYRLDAGQVLADVCDGWDLWYLFADYCPERTHGLVYSSGPLAWPDGGKSFDGFSLVAVPLYSVNSMDNVVELMARVRGAAAA